MKIKKEKAMDMKDTLTLEKEGKIPVFARKLTVLKKTQKKGDFLKKRNLEVKAYQTSLHYREHDYKAISKPLKLS